jgi:cell division protein ZapD
VAQNTNMIAFAHNTSIDSSTARLPEYEQPLNERMRTLMRLEFLYQQLLYNCKSDSDWATRGAVLSLLEIMAILTRGDVRAEVHKELDLQIDTLSKFQNQPGVDSDRLGALFENLITSREEVDAAGTQFMQTLKNCEFLSSIKHRSSIPGGTCEFDLPEYGHWLRQPPARRTEDMDAWLKFIQPLCDAVTKLLWLIRESARPAAKKAVNGMYQHRMQKGARCLLLRVALPPDSSLYPEISGNQHRFTVRFLEWSTIDSRAVQAAHDVDFDISIC